MTARVPVFGPCLVVQLVPAPVSVNTTGTLKTDTAVSTTAAVNPGSGPSKNTGTAERNTSLAPSGGGAGGGSHASKRTHALYRSLRSYCSRARTQRGKTEEPDSSRARAASPVTASVSACEASASTRASPVKAVVESVSVRSSPEDSIASGATPPTVTWSPSDAVATVSTGAASTGSTNLVSTDSSESLQSVIGLQSIVAERTNVGKSEPSSTTNENRGCNVDNTKYTNSYNLCTGRDCDKYVSSEEITNQNKRTSGLTGSTATSSSVEPAIKSASDCSISKGAELNKVIDFTVSQDRGHEPGGDTDAPHFTAVRKSPTRRSSFFHAINASLPPLDRALSGGLCMSSPTSSTPSPSLPMPYVTVPNVSSVPTIPTCVSSTKTPPRTYFSSSTSQELAVRSRRSESTLTTNSPETTSSLATTPATLTGGSGTPTPTNAEAPSGPALAAGAGGAVLNPDSLFKRWVAANAACCWVPELVGAVGAVQLVGSVVGGWLLVGGPPRALATLQHAHAHSLLQPPAGYIIGGLGEMSGCDVSPVPRAHFTPLGPALCWALHCHGEVGASLDSLRSALGTLFPLMTLPDDATTHAALTDLIRQRLVYHVGRGYALVTPDTYGAQAAVGLPPKHPPFKLLSTSEALTRAHGAADAEPAGPVTHTAVQTDLADLLTQSLTVLTHEQQQRQGWSAGSQLRRGSLRVGRRGAPPSAPPDVATYEARDLTDVTVAAERGVGSSVLTKLLRVSSAPRLASFSAQFPPPEWSRPGAPPHGHCRSTQTRNGHTQPLPDNTLPPASAWTPRSSTLPRRPTRPLSSASLHCPSSSPTPPHTQEHNLYSSSNCTPSHHPRQHHQSTSYSARVSSESNVNASNGATTVYANPYRLLALQDQNRTQQQGSHHRHHHHDYNHHDFNQRQHIYASPRERAVATSNSLPNRCNPYATVLSASDSVNALDKSSLPPKPPNNELVHRRTLSASPRRIAGHAREEGTQRQHCSSQLQQQYRGKRQHYSSSAVAISSVEQTAVKNQGLMGGSTERQGLNNAYVAGCDDYDNGMLNLLYNTHPAPTVEHSLNDDCRRLGPSNDNSPKRKHHSGSQRPVFCKHLSPARQKIENTDNERILKERWRLGNLSSSLDSGILPDQRSSHRDSSEDRHRTGTFPAEVGVLADHCWQSRASNDKISGNSKKDGCNRAALQLDLDKSHMNNAKKVFASPQKPEGMKNNRISSDLNNRIKGSTCDLTSKNLGYTDTNKCEKKLYVPNKTNNSLNGKQNISGKLTSIKHVISPTKKRAIKLKQDTIKNVDKKKSNEIVNSHSSTLNLDTNKYTNDIKDARLPKSSPTKNDAIFLIAAPNKDTSSVHYADSSLKADVIHDTTDASSVLPCGSVDISLDGASSVRTYPSLSELNFSSLAAQKILRGVSVNSIDTLLEVNLAACDSKKLKVAEPITNTDFGYL